MTPTDITDRELWKLVYIVSIQNGRTATDASLAADHAVSKAPK